MYTWGYLRNAILAKMDLSEDEANTQNLTSRFPYFANEALTQICSSVMPKYSFAEFVVDDSNKNIMLSMPDDFISFGDDVNTVVREYQELNFKYSTRTEASDNDFTYIGYNKIMFFNFGTYYISYNARWFNFADVENNLSDDTEIDVPCDILDCIPSYVASQLFKIDDEYKAQVYRNEYETFLSRIDDTNKKQTKTFKISGGW